MIMREVVEQNTHSPTERQRYCFPSVKIFFPPFLTYVSKIVPDFQKQHLVSYNIIMASSRGVK